MSKIEDFKSAPVGATATDLDGSGAVKMCDGDGGWFTPSGNYFSDEMVYWGYSLDRPAPTTAREALDLAWELAHEVKLRQVIPEGTWYLQDFKSGLGEYVAGRDFEITPEIVPVIRTLEPLPDPDPDWLKAPAVMARLDDMARWDLDEPQVFTPAREEEEGHWVAMFSVMTYHWSDLRDVTPLYPKDKAHE